MNSTVLVIIAILLAAVALGAVTVLIFRIRKDRQVQDAELAARAGVLLDPVVQEAVQLQQQLPAVIARVKELQAVVVEGRQSSEKARALYEERIRQLEELLRQQTVKALGPAVGPTGATGPVGPTGPTGATGPAGADGINA